MKNNKEFSYSDLLGEQNWQRLHPAIQKRFGKEVHRTVTYLGVMEQVYLSFAGKVLAQLCRLIGTPLALYSGINVPVEVKVYPDDKLAGMTWDRFYAFPDKKVNRVKSTKCIQVGCSKTKSNKRRAGLVEMVGYGFGMELKVYEKGQAIYFESERFFWQLGRFKCFIPELLSPGKTIVSQKALNENQFIFSLEVTHALLGNVFKQQGIFAASLRSPYTTYN